MNSNMVTVVLVEKTGELKISKYNKDKDELYKKCHFKKNDNFEYRHIWKTKKDKYNFKSVSLYSRDVGKANTENKYDFPPPVDTILYFGCCVLVARDEDDENVDLSVEEWEIFYEDLFGGFENLVSTAIEDENEEDELENIPSEMKTKSGYLKDDFVVDDTSNNTDDEYNSTSELEFEDYIYSDED